MDCEASSLLDCRGHAQVDFRFTPVWKTRMTRNQLRVGAAALALSLFALPALSQPSYSTEFLTNIPTGSRWMISGPEIGERIPQFEAQDQNRNLVSLDDVMGPNGAMVVFVRSADW